MRHCDLCAPRRMRRLEIQFLEDWHGALLCPRCDVENDSTMPGKLWVARQRQSRKIHASLFPLFFESPISNGTRNVDRSRRPVRFPVI
jgi:hypothetical protein